MRRFALLLMVAVLGCGDDDEPVQRNLDAGPQDSGTDAARDASSGDASLDASVSCYSPLQPPRNASSQNGCACIATVTSGESAGYCVEGDAVYCSGSRWSFAADGPCQPRFEPYPVGSCAALKGTEMTGTTCPSGFVKRGVVRGDAGTGESATCCYPIEVPRSNCTGAGYRVETPSATETFSCKQGTLKAHVVGESAPSLCCD